MLLHDIIKPENATGSVAKGYEYFSNRMGKVPNVIQLHSLSPDMLHQMINYFEVFEKMPNIDPVIKTYIRLLVSHKGNCEYCVKLNSSILRHMDISDKTIQDALWDMNNINLDEKRKTLILFVVNMMFDIMPNQDKIVELKNHGWTEKDIYEASIVGVMQRGIIQIIKGFQVDIDCE